MINSSIYQKIEIERATMYICICKSVNERVVNEAIEEGCTEWKQLSKKLGVGTECGKCYLTTKNYLNTKVGSFLTHNEKKKK